MKKLLILLLFPLMMFAQDSTLIGDVDCSGEVNSQDASLILQFVTNVIDELPCEANMTGLTPEQLQEMIDMMSGQLNLNYTGSFPIEGWIDHDYQATWCCSGSCWCPNWNNINDACFEDPIINIAASSGIVNFEQNSNCGSLEVYVNNIKIWSGGSNACFPVKKNDEFIIYTSCNPTSVEADNCETPSSFTSSYLGFFSFGDEDGSTSNSNNNGLEGVSSSLNILNYDNNYEIIQLPVPNDFSFSNQSIATDNEGNIYICTQYDSSGNQENLSIGEFDLALCDDGCDGIGNASFSNAGLFIAKYDTLGNVLDVFSIPYLEESGETPSKNLTPYDIVFDSQNNLFLGVIYTEFTFGGGSQTPYSYCLLKLDNNLELVNTKTFVNDFGGYNPLRLAVDVNDDIFVGGRNGYSVHTSIFGDLLSTPGTFLTKFDNDLNPEFGFYLGDNCNNEGCVGDYWPNYNSRIDFLKTTESGVAIFGGYGVISEYDFNGDIINFHYTDNCNYGSLKYVTQDNSKFYVLAHIGDDSNCYDLTYQSLYNWDPNSLIYVVDEDFSVNSISSTGILPASSENINGFEYLNSKAFVGFNSGYWLSNNIESHLSGPGVLQFDQDLSFNQYFDIKATGQTTNVGDINGLYLLKSSNSLYGYVTSFGRTILNNGEFVIINSDYDNGSNTLSLFKIE